MSFSLTDNGKGVPIAIETQGAKRIVFLNEANDKKSYEELDGLTDLTMLPTEKRQILYVAGAQDSGKSYRVKEYVKCWVRMYPKKPVIIISRLDSDVTLAEIEGKFIRYVPSISWIKDKWNLGDLHDSLVVFDDIVSSHWSDDPDMKEQAKQDKALQRYLFDLVDDLAMNGRHANIHMIITSHDLYHGKDTSRILKDATTIILFPRTTGEHHLQYFLKDYIGLSKPQIADFKSIDSRWVAVFKNHPRYFMWDSGLRRYQV